MSRHAQVVIRTPDSNLLLAPGELLGKRETISFAEHALENTVGMILLLLRNLLVEKILVGKES